MKIVNLKYSKIDPKDYRPVRKISSGTVYENPVKKDKECPQCGEIHTERHEIHQCYAFWFWRKVNDDMEFREKVMALKGYDLGCFCEIPELCHGDIILRWFERGCPLEVQ